MSDAALNAVLVSRVFVGLGFSSGLYVRRVVAKTNDCLVGPAEGHRGFRPCRSARGFMRKRDA